MKALITADLHIHPWRECSKDGGQDRLHDGLEATRQTLQAAQERHAPWVCLGDLKHLKDRWLLSVLNGLRALFTEFEDLPKLLLHGNHDGIGGGRSGLDAFRGIPNTLVIEEPFVCTSPPTILGWKEPVAFWPWQGKGIKTDYSGLPAFLEQARKAKAQDLFGHAFFSGSVLGPKEVRLDKGITLEAFGLVGKGRIFRRAYFGDVHKRQSIGPVDGTVTPVYVPGSPYAQNWGELEAERSCLFVDTGRGAADQFEAVLIQAPRFIVADWTDAEEINTRLKSAMSHRDVKAWAGHFVRLLLPPRADPELVERLREASGARVFQAIRQRESKVEQRANVHAGMSSDQMLSAYVTARPLEGFDPQAVLAAGTQLWEDW